MTRRKPGFLFAINSDSVYIRASMALTPKQEKFAQNVAAGMSLVSAYSAAYGADKSTTAATTLAKNPDVAQRIQDLRNPVIVKKQISLEDHIYRLERLRDASEKLGQMSAAIKAEENIGKVLGFYVTKTELSGANGGPVDIRLVKQIIDTDLV